MSVFDDFLYPDNQRRANRATQLYQDCDLLASQLGRQKAVLDAGFETVRRALAEAMPDDHGLAGQVRFNPSEHWTIEVPAVVGPLLSWSSIGLKGAALAGEALCGTPLGLLFNGVFGLPEGFPKRTTSGPIDFKDLFGILPAAIDGAIVRSQLRDLIKSLRASRLEMKQAQLVNETLGDALKGLAAYVVSAAASIRKGDGSADEQKAALADLLRDYVDELQCSISGITEDVARKALDGLDSDRRAWTDEDAYA